VLVMAPAVPEVFVPDVEDVNVIRFGVLKLARFSRLNISARNWRASRSPRVVVLKAEKSQVEIHSFRSKMTLFIMLWSKTIGVAEAPIQDRQSLV
jgi:hypothetical protein